MGCNNKDSTERKVETMVAALLNHLNGISSAVIQLFFFHIPQNILAASHNRAG